MPGKKIGDKNKVFTTVGPIKIYFPLFLVHKSICGDKDFMKRWETFFGDNSWGKPTNYFKNQILKDLEIKDEKEIIDLLPDKLVKEVTSKILDSLDDEEKTYITRKINQELLEIINTKKAIKEKTEGKIYFNSFNEYVRHTFQEGEQNEK